MVVKITQLTSSSDKTIRRPVSQNKVKLKFPQDTHVSSSLPNRVPYKKAKIQIPDTYEFSSVNKRYMHNNFF